MVRTQLLTHVLAGAFAFGLVACGDDGEDKPSGTSGMKLWDDGQGASETLAIAVKGKTSDVVVPFTYSAAAGLSGDNDLTVRANGSNEVIAQVFTDKGQGFLRSGLKVQPIQAGVAYDLRIALTDGKADVSVSGVGFTNSVTLASNPSELSVERPSEGLVARHVQLGDIR